MALSFVNKHLNFINSFSSFKSNVTNFSSSPENKSNFYNDDKSLFKLNFSQKNLVPRLNINNSSLEFLGELKKNKIHNFNDNLEVKYSSTKNSLKGDTGNKLPITGSSLPLNNIINNMQTGVFEINLRDLTGSLQNQNFMSFSTTLDFSANQLFFQQPVYHINTSINNSLWGSHLQNQIRWFIGNNINRAEIYLNPPELGSLFIRIDQKNDAATLKISAQNNFLKDQLESSISKLKDLFEKQGLELVDVHISNESNQQSFSQNQSEFKTGPKVSIKKNDIEIPSAVKMTLEYMIIDEYV